MFAVIITALDETWSLKETVRRVAEENRETVSDIIMTIAPHTTADCRAAIDEMEAAYPGLVRRYEQRRLPGVGGALRECVELVDAEWFVMMSSDLETPPDRVREMIARARTGDVDVVATSRWMAGGDFGNYHPVKLMCNWVFQKFFSALYGCALTDMTFGFRVYRTALFRRFCWTETGMAFFFESLCKPLRMGARVVEIPVQWRRREEGESHIKASEFVRYFRVGLAVRFMRRKRFVAADAA